MRGRTEIQHTTPRQGRCWRKHTGGVMKRAWGVIRHVWRNVLAGWAPYLEKTISAEEVSLAMTRASIPSFGYFFMLGIATAIATFGLVVNSAPTIIGAMIIAPLMSPILSLSYGLVTFDRRLITRSIVTVAAGTVLVIAIAFAMSVLFGLRLTGSEIIARTSPTLFDLGVAVPAGAAAAFSQTRRSIASSIAGVAIAVALVPPLAVSGIGLAVGPRATVESGMSLAEFASYAGGVDIASGAFVLFLTNLVGIIVVAMLVFICQRYGEWKKALVALVAIMICSVFLVRPLNKALYKIYVKDKVVLMAVKLATTRPDIIAGAQGFETLNVFYRDGVLHVYADMFMQRDKMENLQGRLDEFRRFLSAEVGEPVVVDMTLAPVDVVSVHSAPPEATKSASDAAGMQK